MEERQVLADRRSYLRVAVGCRLDGTGPGAGFAESDGPGCVVAQDALLGCLLHVTGLGVFEEPAEGFDAEPQSGSGFGAYEQLVRRPNGADSCTGNRCAGGDERCWAKTGDSGVENGQAADAEPEDEGDRSDDVYDGLALAAGSVPVRRTMEPIVQFALELVPSLREVGVIGAELDRERPSNMRSRI